MGSESPAAVLFDMSGNELPVQNGAAIPASTPMILVGGSDGANSRYFTVDTSGRIVLVGAGTAGTPTGGVLSIQGVSGGQTVPISGTVASTGVADVTATGSLGALNATVQIALAGTNYVSFEVPLVNASLTVTPQVSFDGGSTWFATRFKDGSTGTLISTNTWSGITANTNETIVVPGGASHARVIVSAYTSGTITANLRASTILSTFLLSEQAAGFSLPPTMVQMGGSVTTSSPAYSTATLNALSLTTAGALRIDGSAVTQPVSGTVTANQGTPNTLANAWTTEITDGTHGPVAVKAASTAAVATDPALVVAVSPNNTVAVTQSTSPWVTNITQFGNNNVVTGTGVSGVGIPRVTVSTDSNILATQSGTWTVAQGASNTLVNAWATKITDGTNGPVAVKAASTAAVAADPALVVSISPNSAVAISQSDITATGSLGALNATVSVVLNGTNNSGMQLVAGTLVGTIVPEVSLDGGTTWVSTFFDDPTTNNKTSSIVFGSSNTATTRSIIGSGGASNARVRVSAYTSGTATCNVRASTTQDPTLTSEGAIGTSTIPPTGIQIGGSNPSSNFTAAITSNSGALGIAVMGNEFVVQTNATVTSSGSQTITKNFYGVQQINLIVNVTGSITGTTPTLTYTIQELDPGNNTTVMGNSATTATISATGVYTAILTTTTSSAVKVSWTITGTTPSFGGVYATVISKATPSSQQITTAATAAVPGNAQGYVNTTATTNVAVQATTYTEQSANFTGSVKSSSASDAAAGTGARTITIYYVDQTGATAGTETATLNGTTAVNLVTTTKCFIEKIVVNTVGSTGSNVGIISLFTGAAGAGTTVVTIAATDNQTYLGHHYVVSGKTCNITGLTGINNSSNQTVFTLQATTLPVANQVSTQVSDWVTGSQTFQVVRLYDQLIKVAGPARIQLFGAPGGTPNIKSQGSFDFYDQ